MGAWRVIAIYKFNSQNLEHKKIKSWFLEWEKFVQKKQYSSALQFFENDVVSFGTWMDVVEGLDQLKINQWENIWPTISGFKFLTETLFIQLSPDKLFANSILTWTSLGYHQDGKNFWKIRKSNRNFKKIQFKFWIERSTHTFSLNRGVPQQSFGNFK